MLHICPKYTSQIEVNFAFGFEINVKESLKESEGKVERHRK